MFILLGNKDEKILVIVMFAVALFLLAAILKKFFF
ncbi:hypothetical protein BSG1_06027 [Bacillus sp. SG-1]|nr:hypothetical protein BSG1_06027 [Bacillus sp. SG-1]